MDVDIESLKSKTALVFGKYNIPEPLTLEIRPRSMSLTKPRLISNGESLIFVQMTKAEDYDAQISWVAAHHIANNYESIFVRKAALLEILLMVLFAIDGIFVLILPEIIELIPGLLVYILLQTVCLVLAFKVWKGKGQQGRIIGDTMVDTESWDESRAETHIQYKEGFFYTLPLVGIVIVSLVAWTLFFL